MTLGEFIETSHKNAHKIHTKVVNGSVFKHYSILGKVGEFTYEETTRYSINGKIINKEQFLKELEDETSKKKT